VERITSGAFARTLKSRNNIQLLHAHNPELILGSTRAKTLRLEEDGKGLKVSADLPDTSWGRDVAELVRRGDLAHMSFGFSVPRGGDEWSEDGKNRTLTEVRLHEVSTVGAPAYQKTSASVRALDCPQCVSDPDGWVCLLERFANREELTANEARSIAEAAQELTAERPRGLPAALAKLMLGHYARGSSRAETRGALPAHNTPTVRAAWDGAQAVARAKSPATEPYYGRIYAFLTPEANDERKSSYGFPHHEVASDGTPGPAVLDALAAGIAALNGARGGSTLRGSVRQGVYDHLAHHYEALGDDTEAPPLRS
jgi:HK97 family phage prohead protease